MDTLLVYSGSVWYGIQCSAVTRLNSSFCQKLFPYLKLNRPCRDGISLLNKGPTLAGIGEQPVGVFLLPMPICRIHGQAVADTFC